MADKYTIVDGTVCKNRKRKPYWPVWIPVLLLTSVLIAAIYLSINFGGAFLLLFVVFGAGLSVFLCFLVEGDIDERWFTYWHEDKIGYDHKWRSVASLAIKLKTMGHYQHEEIMDEIFKVKSETDPEFIKRYHDKLEQVIEEHKVTITPVLDSL